LLKILVLANPDLSKEIIEKENDFHLIWLIPRFDGQYDFFAVGIDRLCGLSKLF
jgi:hypothetical protein